jgi:RNA polymerase sigma-70 factor (ECF subfamily)
MERELAFRQIYDRHAPAVFADLARRVPRDQVDDLAAETFLVAWRKLPPGVEEPLPWLYAVARRVLLAHLRGTRGRARLAARIAGLIPRDAASPEPELQALDGALAGALARLTLLEREALLLVAWEDLDHAAGARVVGCTAATFTVRVSRARTKLRAALGDAAIPKETLR